MTQSDKQELIKEIKKDFNKNMKLIEECPFFPKYPSVWFKRGTSKLELREKLITRTIKLIACL